jgi:hypothetical protein
MVISTIKYFYNKNYSPFAVARIAGSSVSKRFISNYVDRRQKVEGE